jgi:hypothetical protein
MDACHRRLGGFLATVAVFPNNLAEAHCPNPSGSRLLWDGLSSYRTSVKLQHPCGVTPMTRDIHWSDRNDTLVTRLKCWNFAEYGYFGGFLRFVRKLLGYGCCIVNSHYFLEE